MAPQNPPVAHRTIATNRRAHYDYFIESSIEVGLVLAGTEVKSLRGGRANVSDAYAAFDGREAFIHNLQISPYEMGNINNKPERRPRKLLLHRQEIAKLQIQVRQKGYTLVALELYFKGSLVKLRLGLAKGKKSFDKRDTIRDADNKRELDRALKASRRD